MNENKQNAVAEVLNRYRAEIDRLRGQLESAENGKMKENPYFDDFEKNREQILNFAKEHALSQKQAYGALFGEAQYAKAAETFKKKNAAISALSEKGNKAEEGDDGVLSGGEMWAAKKSRYDTFTVFKI